MPAFLTSPTPRCLLLSNITRIINSNMEKKNKQRTDNTKANDSTSNAKIFGPNKLVIGGDDASHLIGSIIEKGISVSQNNRNPTLPPKLTVLPFPVARHRSHGPHWSPIGSEKGGDDGNEGGEEDNDSIDFDPVSAFANPVRRKQKKGLDLSRWRELATSDNLPETDDVEEKRLRLKRNEKDWRDRGALMEVDAEPHLSFSAPPTKMGDEKGTSVANMEIDNSDELEVQVNATDASSGVKGDIGSSERMKSNSIAKTQLGKMEELDPLIIEKQKSREQKPSTVVSSTFHNFENAQGSMSLESEIDAENCAHLQRMSPEEIAQAQAEIMEKMDPALVSLLKKRGQGKLKRQNVSRPVEATNIPLVSENTSIKNSAASPLVGSDSSKRMAVDASKDIKSGLDNGVVKNYGPSTGSLWSAWSKRVEAVRGLRFSLEGTLVADNLATDTTSMDNVTERDFLRTEGDPGASGYTIKEAVQLTRSVIPGQRALALHLLASVLEKAIHNIQQYQVGCTIRNVHQVDKLTDWDAIWAYALGPEPELVLALRMCLDDNHTSVVLACAKVIKCVLSCDLNENFFENSEKIATYKNGIFTAPVFRSKSDISAGFLCGSLWKYSAKPSNILALGEDSASDDDTEGKHTIQDDIVVAGQDFAAGLVRMSIVPRMLYLLEANPTEALEECVIGILIAIARHSPTCANAIMKCPRLVHTVVHRFTHEGSIEIRPSKIKSVILLKVLAQSDKNNCAELIKNGYFQAMTHHLYRYTPSLNHWVQLGKENCKLSSALVVEELRLWKICIHYGYCISNFSDIFPALCLWLNPPNFMKLHEHNVLEEFASVAKEAYLVLEALARKLPNFYLQRHQVLDCAGDELETWSWNFVTPMVDLALKWIIAKSDPDISRFFEWHRGSKIDHIFQDSSVRSLLWVYSAVMRMLSTVLEKMIPEDITSLQDSSRHVPWLPEFVPKVGLEIIKNGFLSFLCANDTEHGKDFAEGGSFVQELCHLRQEANCETSLASVCCLHGLLQLITSIDDLIHLAKSGINSNLSQGSTLSREEKILEDGITKQYLVELRPVLSVFMKLVASEWHIVQSIEMFSRGGPAPGVGVGWGSSGGGFWSVTVLLAQADAGLLILMLKIFHMAFNTESQLDEDMAFTMDTVNSVLGACLICGPRDKVTVEKALDILLQVSAFKCLDFFIQRLLQSNKRMKQFGWEYKEEDYLLFCETLASHFKNKWFSVKRKSNTVDGIISSGKNAHKKGNVSLETIHEDFDTSNTANQDHYPTTLTLEWAHQKLPLPKHWFLSPISTLTDKIDTGLQCAANISDPMQDPFGILEVAKCGLFFLLGVEAMSTYISADISSPIRSVPLVWKLHSLSVILLVGMGVLDNDASRGVYETLQDLYGQLLDEARTVKNSKEFLEQKISILPEAGNKSTVEFLRFQSEIHESYSTFLETLVEQFAAISYGDLIFGRQVAAYLHRCTEVPVRLSAWNALANARVLEILPPLEKCFAEAEGYLEPIEDNEDILEAYGKTWISGALDRAATRGSMAFTLVLHHLSSFIFHVCAKDKIPLRNRLAKSLVRDYSQKQRHEGMMLELIGYCKPSTSRVPEEREDWTMQSGDYKLRFEILVEACERDSSLLAVFEKLKWAFVNRHCLVNQL